MRILVADDDPQILRALRITLGAKGYEVITAADGAQAVSRAADRPPDLVLLDLGMPGLDGIEVIQALRGWSRAPILVVSGRTDSADKVDALDAGADDYVTKPFAVDELLARLRALARRAGEDETAGPVVRLGTITVDLAARSVHAAPDGDEGHAAPRQIRLTPTEWKVLEVLARHPATLVSRGTLLTSIWGGEHVEDTGYLRLYVSQLRRKLEPDPSHPRYRLTEAGMGYRLRPDDD